MSMPAEQVTPIYDIAMALDFFRMIERDGSLMMCQRALRAIQRSPSAFCSRPATQQVRSAPGAKC